jgi:hypothetical protein
MTERLVPRAVISFFRRFLVNLTKKESRQLIYGKHSSHGLHDFQIHRAGDAGRRNPIIQGAKAGRRR